ncbi:MAG TPA: glycosyl hydrolase family 18 protein [Ktedonobacterales bacterium]|nr:glycosyl hydrolase family 18 protein [Ktedonobacterales bacterium]
MAQESKATAIVGQRVAITLVGTPALSARLGVLAERWLGYAQPNDLTQVATRRRKIPVWPAPAHTKQPPRGHLGRFIRWAALIALILAVVLASALGYAYWRLSATVTDYTGAHFNQGHNAVWLEHGWVGQAHSDADYDALAQQLQREQITYVFAHVGPLQSDGTIPDSLAPNAQGFASAMHTRLPGLRILAWVGQLEAASGLPADQVVNLGDAQVRLRIAHTAARFVTDDGFDGVHYDIEPITNNNDAFIELLDETRAILPPGAILSVSGEKWAPSARVASLLYQQGRAGEWWTSYYYAEVAAHVDQIAVMTYDTGMPTSTLYQLFVKQETQHILDDARSAKHPPQVLIGAPTYSGNDPWYHSSAENMQSALLGVTAGLNSDRQTQPFVGVAIYRYAVTSDSSWATYNHLWLGK